MSKTVQSVCYTVQEEDIKGQFHNRHGAHDPHHEAVILESTKYYYLLWKYGVTSIAILKRYLLCPYPLDMIV